jgi:hypothetical protein
VLLWIVGKTARRQLLITLKTCNRMTARLLPRNSIGRFPAAQKEEEWAHISPKGCEHQYLSVISNWQFAV